MPMRYSHIYKVSIIFLFVLISIPVCAANNLGVEETKLPNGLTVLIKEVHSAPVFTAQLWFKVGSRN